jgi:hypothetical protein
MMEGVWAKQTEKELPICINLNGYISVCIYFGSIIKSQKDHKTSADDF